MADPRDEHVTRAYRDMPGGDGPPPALDAAIQAAARRAVGARPGASRRWQIPISVAAVLVLAVGVALQVEREQGVTPEDTTAASVNAGSPAVVAAPEAVRVAPAPMPEAPAVRAPRAVSVPVVPSPAPPPAAPMNAEAARKSFSARESIVDAPETPEQSLERIAALRARGLHEQADRALSEFRRAYPNHPISEEWLRKVERGAQ